MARNRKSIRSLAQRLVPLAMAAFSVLHVQAATAPVSVTGGIRGVNVLAFGAVGDGISVTDGVIQAGSLDRLTSVNGLFTPAASGKTISIQGAGPGGSQLVTTIATYVSPSQIILRRAASAGVSGAGVIWGTDNFSVFHTALASAAGKRLVIPNGNYLINTQGGSDVLEPTSNTTISMDPKGRLYFVGCLSRSHQTSDLFVIRAASKNINFLGIRCVGEWLTGIAAPYMNNSACINAAGSSSQNVRIQNGVFSNMFGHGIAGMGDNRTFDISHNLFRHNANTGVNFNGSHANISDNTFIDDGGVEAGGGWSTYEHNMFTRSTGQYALSVGGNTSGIPYRGTRVIGNVIRDPVYNCISVGDGFEYGTIADNQCLGISGAHMGIANVYSGYTHADHNVFIHDTVTGISTSAAFYFHGVTGPRLRGNSNSGSFSTGLMVNKTTAIDSVGNVWQGWIQDVRFEASSTGTAQDRLVHGTYRATGGSVFSKHPSF